MDFNSLTPIVETDISPLLENPENLLFAHGLGPPTISTVKRLKETLSIQVSPNVSLNLTISTEAQKPAESSPKHSYAVPPGTLIVVTGANGLIGSHVVDQLLLAGFKVRGIVRSLKKAWWMEDFFNNQYGPGLLSLLEVPNMAAAGADDDVLHGAVGVCHVGTPVTETCDPSEGITPVVASVMNMLEACAAEPTVKRVVLTSSSTATISPMPNEDFTVTSETWNDAAVARAWAATPSDNPQQRLDIYFASKTQAERAAWKLTADKKPGYTLNVVNTPCNVGLVLSPEDQGSSTIGWLHTLWDKFRGHDDLKFTPPQWYVNVQDAARVHVAALVYTDVHSERLLAWAHPFQWTDMLAFWRKQYAEATTPGELKVVAQEVSGELGKVDNQRAEELLQRIKGSGWTSLEDSVEDAAKGWAWGAQINDL